MPDEAESNRAYLTVIAWPDGMSRAQRAELVASATGSDLPTMLLKIGMTPPAILGEVDMEAAEAAAQAIIARGGDAFTPTMDQIESLGPTHKIKRLTRDGSNFHAEMWRGEDQVIRGDEVQVVIRARLSQAESKGSPSDVSPTLLIPMFEGERLWSTARPGRYGAFGLALSFGALSELPTTGSTPPDAHLAHKIDVHVADGRVFQIDADKFGFEVLGDHRGPSDLVNTDRLCELLALLAPNAVVDPYFSLFKPPPECRRLRLPMMVVNKDDPAFAFYSRWAALMYRYLQGQARTT